MTADAFRRRRGRRDWPDDAGTMSLSATPPALFSAQCAELREAVESGEINIAGLTRALWVCCEDCASQSACAPTAPSDDTTPDDVDQCSA